MPIVLIPGIAERWGFLKRVGDTISLEGHPVYIVPRLGRTFLDIPQAAELVREVIDQQNLQNVVIVAHSKGGLIGKYLLVHHNSDKRIKAVIAVATPFSGSRLGRFIPHRSFKELTTGNKLLHDLESHITVNKDIVSLFPASDQHVIHEKGSYLEGAENIEIALHGHHKLVLDKRGIDKILEVVQGLTKIHANGLPQESL